MTHEEARREARRRWGFYADVIHWDKAQALNWKPFVVGHRSNNVFEVYGEGDCWEEAFQKADQRAGLLEVSKADTTTSAVK
jgi:hypothetical protein